MSNKVTMDEPRDNRLDVRADSEHIAGSLPDLMSEARALAAMMMQGHHVQRRAGGGEKFWQFRDYDEADRPQDIDWRRSARGDQVFIRQKELQTAQRFLFWCARGHGMDFRSERAAYSKSHAASVLMLAMGLMLARGGEHIGAADDMRFGHSELAMERLGRYLTSAEEQGDLPVGSVGRKSTLMAAGDFWQPLEEIEAWLGRVKASGAHAVLLQIIDPAERDLPYQGRAIIEDPAGKLDFDIANIGSVRGAYQEKIERHLSGLRDLCDRLQFDYIMYQTDQPLEHGARALWACLDKRKGAL